MTIGGIQDDTQYTLVSAAGDRAVFNVPDDPDYVGMARFTGLDDSEVREVADDRPEDDGGVHGAFWRGRRPVTANVQIVPESVVDRNEKYDKLMLAVGSALRQDSTLTWAPDGSVPQFIRLRKQGPIRRSEDPGWLTTIQVPMVASDPFKYSTQLRSMVRSGDVADFKALITDLSPALYWALDAEDGATDLSGNGRNGTGAGGITVGTGDALTSLSGDSSTFFTAGYHVTSSYAPFTAATARTFMGLAAITPDTGPMVTGSTASDGVFQFVYEAPAGPSKLRINIGGVDHDLTGVGFNNTFMWAAVIDQPNDELSLYLNGLPHADNPVPIGDFAGGLGNFWAGAASGVVDGYQSHLAVWESALTATEIGTIAAAVGGQWEAD